MKDNHTFVRRPREKEPIGSAGPLPEGVRLPRQSRSRASFDRMIEAALGLIREEGLEGATVQKILKDSGTGAGTFYARFDSRDALLAYLMSRFWVHTEHEWQIVLRPEGWLSARVVEIVYQFTQMLVLWTCAHGALLRAFLMHAMAHGNQDLLDQISVADNTIADHMCTLLLTHSTELKHQELEQAIRLATLQVVATVRSRIIFAWGSRKDGIDDHVLATELATAFLRYLGCSDNGSWTGSEGLGARARAVGLRENATEKRTLF